MAAFTVQHPKNITIADFTGTVTLNNSSGGTTTGVATDLARPSDWNSAHNVSFSLSASDITAILEAKFVEAFQFANSNSISASYSSQVWAFDPVQFPEGLDSGHFRLFNARDASHFSNTVSANSTLLGGYSITAVFKNRIAIYSQGDGSDATRLNTLWTGQGDISATQSQSYAGATSGMTVSNYLTIGMITDVDNSGGSSTATKTTSGTFSTGTTSMAATKADSLITGAHNWFTGSCMDMIPFSSSLPPGNYYLGYMHDTSTGGGGTTGVNRTSAGTWFNGTMSRFGVMDVNVSAFKKLGKATSADSSSMAIPFHGSLLTQSSLASASLGSANLQMTTRRIYWNFIQGSM